MLMRATIIFFGISALLRAEDFGLARREFAQSVLAKSRGDLAQSVVHEEAARAAHPTAMLLVTRAAKRALQQGDVKQASALYRELAHARPNSLRAQFLYADFLREQGSEDDFALRLAIETLEKARTSYPAEPEIFERLLRIYEQQGKREKSQALYQDYLKLPQADPTVAEMFARILHDSDDAQSRAQLDRMYREKMKLEPENPTVARAASEHFRKTERLEEAIEMLLLHVKAAPSSLELRVRLGVLQLSAEKSEAGEKTLLDVLDIAPTQFLAHQALAKLYGKQQKPELARKHRAELLKIRGGEAEEFAALGKELLDAVENQAARILLEKAVFSYPKDGDLAYLLAIATHADPAQTAQAPALFRQAEKLFKEPSTNPYYLRTAAESYWANQSPEEAEKQLRQAIKLYPATAKKESATALRLLASWWQQQGKNAEAAKALLQRAEMLER